MPGKELSKHQDLIDGLRDEVNRLDDRIEGVHLAKPKPGGLSPTWKGIAGLAVTALGVLFVMWMTSVAADVKSVADSSAQALAVQTRALASQGERVASVETWRTATDGRLDRMDKGIDRIETKLDRVLDKR